MKILGIWDGHDSGACIVENGVIKVAINEERLTRKKLDICFPYQSINTCLSYLDLKPNDIDAIAICGTQFSRILARQFPFLDRNFYYLRRRKIPKPFLERQRRYLKYFLARYNAPYLKGLVKWQVRNKLEKVGFQNPNIFIIDHHLAHAASAIFTSGFEKSLCITLDGVGDGLSGTINIYNGSNIERIASFSERDSLGLFYEEVTTILGFRELEDEGKVMAIADYSYPIPDSKNSLIDFFEVNGIKIKSKYGTIKRFRELDKIKWQTPLEKFAYMAQKTLERKVTALFQNAIEEVKIYDVCFAGGVASNIKLNRTLRLYSGAKNLFVFPHMGDGGLAVGAALYLAFLKENIKPKRIDNLYWGIDFTQEEIENELKNFSNRIEFEKVDNPSKTAADLLLKNNYVFWFQGRMEYGPRALGARSILAPADSQEIKDKLNISVKEREWFQPFCPTILEEDAQEIFEDYSGLPDRFMTMGYMLKPKYKKIYSPIANVDGSARPQLLGSENPIYRELLGYIKKEKGIGIVLNTSFNIHGQPIVCSPKDAIEVMIQTKTDYMVIGSFLVKLKK